MGKSHNVDGLGGMWSMRVEDGSLVGGDHQQCFERATRGEGNRDEPKSFSLRASVGKAHHGNDMQIPCQTSGNFQNSCNSVCLKGLWRMG